MKAHRSAPSAGDDALTLFDAAPLPESPILEDVGEMFPGASARSAIAVSTLTETVKDIVEGAFIPLWVRGEISDFKVHRNGHWYFSLRDLSSQLKCVVWTRDQLRLPAAPDDGMQVAVFGHLGVYAARGEIRFTVKRIEAEGEGLWRKAFDAARARLEKDGLLDPRRKRAIPRFPRRIALVTSASGAALHDVIAVLRRRAVGVELVVVDAAVQGDSAPLELCRALDAVKRWGGAELVIVARGGGSREDLWAFNDERVARAIAMCPIPTISAVGHEIDFSLCDLVADLRAPTPSAAAEAAIGSHHEVARALASVRQRILDAMHDRIEYQRLRAVDAARAMQFALTSRITRHQMHLAGLSGRLHALSPLATLERGYAVARDADGKTLASTGHFSAGMPFVLRLRDGDVDAVVQHVSTEEAP